MGGVVSRARRAFWTPFKSAQVPATTLECGGTSGPSHQAVSGIQLLPVELWSKVISFHTVKHPICPLCNDQGEEGVGADNVQDCWALVRVCRVFRALALELIYAHIVIRDEREADVAIQALSLPILPPASEQRGSKTRRVDFRTTQTLDHRRVMKLLSCTPNLRVLINDSTVSQPAPYLLISGVESLYPNMSRLRRLDFQGARGPPTLSHIVTIAQSCRELESLSLQCLQIDALSSPSDLDMLPNITFPALRFLTLLANPPGRMRADYSKNRDMFLALLSKTSTQLPHICGLRVEQALSSLHIGFFQQHGNKLEVLEVSTLSTQLPVLTSHCSRLRMLALLHTLRRQLRPDFTLSGLPPVARIDIRILGTASCIDSNALPAYAELDVDCVGTLLDEICLKASLEHLAEVRVPDLEMLHHTIWGHHLDSRFLRFRLMRIKLADREGQQWPLTSGRSYNLNASLIYPKAIVLGVTHGSVYPGGAI
ncbi:hypothetical protein FA13DRAFT_1719140 [Coprinellus micaceus]|uniref:F-box domain-containing protein n=1 Tax=Coprinellus micaceus TaxID=71717 RepID=A0A4Y7SCF7_COPMI|nr:hypothetical protein FA13DRAFT_1719140 [Coprinellus micaceus]